MRLHGLLDLKLCVYEKRQRNTTRAAIQLNQHSTAWAGEITLTYNAAELLVNMDLTKAELSERQHIWFLQHEPKQLIMLQELVDKTNTLTLTQVEQTVSFEQFWNKYDLNAVSSKKKTAAKWNKLSKTEQIKAHNYC